MGGFEELVESVSGDVSLDSFQYIGTRLTE